MKHVLLSLTFLGLLAVSAIAGHSRALFTTKHQQPIKVILNGDVVNHYPSTQVEVDYLPAGRHQVTIQIFGRRRMYRSYSQVILVKPGFTNHFALTRGYGGLFIERTSLTRYYAGNFGQHRFGHYYSPGIRYVKGHSYYNDSYRGNHYTYYRYQYKHHRPWIKKGKWLHGSHGHVAKFEYGKGPGANRDFYRKGRDIKKGPRKNRYGKGY